MSKKWKFTLYIAGTAPESTRARANLASMVKKYLTDVDVKVDVCDLLESPAKAREENILALPTLIREEPQPVSRVIGDLSDIERLWAAVQDG